jgi:hypothetical protein
VIVIAKLTIDLKGFDWASLCIGKNRHLISFYLFTSKLCCFIICYTNCVLCCLFGVHYLINLIKYYIFLANVVKIGERSNRAARTKRVRLLGLHDPNK